MKSTAYLELIYSELIQQGYLLGGHVVSACDSSGAQPFSQSCGSKSRQSILVRSKEEEYTVVCELTHACMRHNDLACMTLINEICMPTMTSTGLTGRIRRSNRTKYALQSGTTVRYVEVSSYRLAVVGQEDRQHAAKDDAHLS